VVFDDGVFTVSRKRKKKRERLKKQEIERNKGRVYCTIRVFCEGDCRNHNFKRNGRLCSEAYYKTGDGEIPVTAKIGMEGGEGAPPRPFGDRPPFEGRPERPPFERSERPAFTPGPRS
jgi:hypothetical protein